MKPVERGEMFVNSVRNILIFQARNVFTSKIEIS